MLILRSNLAFLRVGKLLFGLRYPLSRQALRLGVAASIEHFEAFRGSFYQTIVDVGANKGQFALFSRVRFPTARIISYEPLAAPAQKFQALFADDPCVTLHPYALGESSQRCPIYITAADDSSSLLRVGDRQREIFKTREVGAWEINVRRLDETIMKGDLEHPALLKIDVQGYEGSVLRGCGKLLDDFDDIYVELSYVELYRDQASAGEVIELLRLRGFDLRGVFNQYCDLAGHPIQADFLFRRTRGASFEPSIADDA